MASMRITVGPLDNVPVLVYINITNNEQRSYQQMNNIQLHVGYIGITREGKRVEIESIDSSDNDYPWVTTCGDWYTDTGKFDYDHDCNDDEDIIGPWVETPVEPQVNYNDGNWHRWYGATADGPVHESSTVQVRLFNPADEYGDMTDLASEWWWEQPCDSPILAFRVTKEYVALVEPREFWIQSVGNGLADVKTEKPSDMYGYIHVREVI
jgi:hypothetical protein